MRHAAARAFSPSPSLLRTSLLVVSAVLVAEVLAILLRVPGIGWWTCAAMIYVAVSCVGACIFVVETRRL